jgi:uncharacterized protein YbaR (Trm112 family)
MKTCYNHTDKKAFSVCRNCKKDYCEDCLEEGKEYYYCKNPDCQKFLIEEQSKSELPEVVVCPNCKSELELSEDEKASKKFPCPECEMFIDLNSDSPRILEKKNYVELVSSLNQGDISLIKSILEDGEIDYYIFGENFLSVRPLVQPAKFFVNVKQLEEAKELLKDYDFNIWGYSTNQY